MVSCAAGGSAAFDVAAATPDPELPMVTIADLGILRAVDEHDGRVVATITPTYSGCPAMPEIAQDVRRRLELAGFADVTVRTALAPAVELRLDHRRRSPQARRCRDRAAALGTDTRRDDAAAAPADPARRRVPAVRLDADRPHG